MTAKQMQSSLALKLAASPNIIIEPLVQRSRESMALHKEEFEHLMNKQIQEIAVVIERRALSSINAIYQASSQIIGTAGFVGAEVVSAAAQSLCELIETMDPDGWDWDAVMVHSMALQHLSTCVGQSSLETSNNLLERLNAVVIAKKK
jgi:hypothetical protein